MDNSTLGVVSTAAGSTAGLLRACEPNEVDVGGRLALHSRLFPNRGLTLERYSVLRRVGRGGMGHVFEAHDPKLERSVAIKVLRGKDQPGQSSTLLTEARAMARLRHPNVVPVHDVGQADGQVFIVMEFVRGQDLRTWLREGERDVPDVLRVFRDAGRGLRAAHRAGIIHRDFKPANVLLDEDGRALVTDFGVAIRSRDPGDEQDTPRYAGTPRYTAPEVAAGSIPTAASDQYSFCLALREALAPLTVRGTHRIRRVRAALHRGLAADPARRWPSMDALLARLDPIPRRFAASATLVGCVCGSAVTMGMVDDSDPCTELVEGMDEDWSSTDGLQVRETLTHRWGDDPRIDRVVSAMDEYADAWRTEATQACAAGPIEPTNLAIACLAASRQELSSAARYLQARLDEPTKALDAVPPVSDVRRCSSWGLLAAPTDASAVAEAELELAALRSRLRVGEPWELVPRFAALASRTQSMEFAPLQAHVLLAQGTAEYQSGALKDAIATWQRAFDDALAGGDLRAAFELAVELAQAHADTHIQQPAEARRWAGHARALAQRQAIDPSRLAAVDMAEGTALSLEHQHEAALALLHDAVARVAAAERSDARGTTDRLVASGNERLAAALHAAGRPARAREAIEAAREAMHRVYGQGHPELIRLHVSSAAIAGVSGDLVTARADLEQARDLAARLHLDADPRTLELYVNLAELEIREGHLDAAIDAASRAVHVAGLVPSLHQDRLALALVVQGSMLSSANRIAEARASAQRAVEVVSSDDRIAAGAHWLLGSIQLRQRDPRAALVTYRMAARIEARGDVHAPNRSTVELAVLELRAGNPDSARAQIVRARALLDTVPPPSRAMYERYADGVDGLIDAVAGEDPDRERGQRAQLKAMWGDTPAQLELHGALLPPRDSAAWTLAAKQL